MPGVFLPSNQPIAGDQGIVSQVWSSFFQSIAASIASLLTTVGAIPGVNNKTVATQPSLGAGDAGYLMWLTDYKHLLRWTGATWEFFGDSSNAFFADFIIAPQTGLWQLCDGTVVNYLTLGGTLTETPFTTPNLVGTPAYRKAAAAYTGAIAAKAGSTGTGTTGTGTTGAAGAHTPHIAGGTKVGIIVNAGSPSAVISVGSSTPWEVLADSGGVDLDAVPDHTHSAPALSVPALPVGTIEMANLGCLPYFRR
jgi:hypothetical protein